MPTIRIDDLTLQTEWGLTPEQYARIVWGATASCTKTQQAMRLLADADPDRRAEFLAFASLLKSTQCANLFGGTTPPTHVTGAQARLALINRLRKEAGKPPIIFPPPPKKP